MGWIHWLAYKDVDGVEVGAILETDPVKRTGDWTGIKGNFGPQGQQVDLSQVTVYDEFQKMLQDPSIDVIDICLPPALHHQFAIEALNAGKHVFCEKPMSLWTDKCDQMVQAASENNKRLLIGHVLPFFPEYTYARQVIDSGKYGKLLGGNFLRSISDPTWLKNFYDPAAVGGPMLDLHVHDAHFIRYLFGMPKAVHSQGRVQGEVAKYWNSLFEFEDSSLCVRATCGVIDQQGRPFSHGFEIQLEKATMHFELAVVGDGVQSMALKLFKEDGTVEIPELPQSDDIEGFRNEIKEVVAAIGSGQPSAILEADLARDAIVMCQMQSEKIFAAQPVS